MGGVSVSVQGKENMLGAASFSNHRRKYNPGFIYCSGQTCRVGESYPSSTNSGKKELKFRHVKSFLKGGRGRVIREILTSKNLHNPPPPKKLASIIKTPNLGGGTNTLNLDFDIIFGNFTSIFYMLPKKVGGGAYNLLRAYNF